MWKLFGFRSPWVAIIRVVLPLRHSAQRWRDPDHRNQRQRCLHCRGTAVWVGNFFAYIVCWFSQRMSTCLGALLQPKVAVGNLFGSSNSLIWSWASHPLRYAAAQHCSCPRSASSSDRSCGPSCHTNSYKIFHFLILTLPTFMTT